jgi:micrococcal nuclease
LEKVMTERTQKTVAALCCSIAVLSLGCPAQPVTVCSYSATTGNCFDRSFHFDDARVAAMNPASLPAAPSVCREPVRAQILRVVDGDTFDVAFPDGTGERIRLIGANTPETHPTDMGLPHCGGGEAFRFSNSMIGRRAILTFDQDCTDSFGRTLAYVWFGPQHSDMWQAQLIRRGLARQLTVAPNDNFAPLFLEDENAARAQTLGIWGACFGDANP